MKCDCGNELSYDGSEYGEAFFSCKKCGRKYSELKEPKESEYFGC